jgi:hypothetical protein
MVAVLALAGSALAQNHPAFEPNGAPAGVLPSAGSSEFKEQPANFVELPESHPAGETSRGPQEGIKVHGHWKIDIKNPDGTVAGTRDFENSLASGGLFLVGTLSGYLVPGDWMIVLGASTGNSPCSGPQYQFCGIVKNLTTYPALNYCASYYCSGSTLSYTYNFGNNVNGPYSIVLAGQITANQAGNIGLVYTLLSGCGNVASPTSPTTLSTTAPSACVANTAADYQVIFTYTTLGSTIAVTSGQIIQVTVTFTFS